jgi:hypothetical protein
VQFGSDLLQE